MNHILLLFALLLQLLPTPAPGRTTDQDARYTPISADEPLTFQVVFGVTETAPALEIPPCATSPALDDAPFAASMSVVNIETNIRELFELPTGAETVVSEGVEVPIAPMHDPVICTREDPLLVTARAVSLGGQVYDADVTTITLPDTDETITLVRPPLEIYTESGPWQLIAADLFDRFSIEVTAPPVTLPALFSRETDTAVQVLGMGFVPNEGIVALFVDGVGEPGFATPIGEALSTADQTGNARFNVPEASGLPVALVGENGTVHLVENVNVTDADGIRLDNTDDFLIERYWGE